MICQIRTAFVEGFKSASSNALHWQLHGLLTWTWLVLLVHSTAIIRLHYVFEQSNGVLGACQGQSH